MSPPPNPTLAHLAAALSEDDARELVRIFLTEFPALRDTMSRGSPRECYMAAHSLKSSAQHMGLEALAERAAGLETRLGEPGTTIAAEDIAGLDRDFAEQAEALRGFVSP
jgi:HPt (histidine-containing phosphotransfer) domain-containing protein